MKARRSHIVRMPDGQRFSSREPCDRRPCGQGDGYDRVLYPWSKGRDECQRQHQAGESQEHIHHSHQNQIDPAAFVSGGGADDQTDRPRDDRGQERDVKSDPRSVNRPAQDIATQFVSAQKMFGIGPRQSPG